MNPQGKLKLGIIGCGRATKNLHLPALTKLRGVQIQALSDTDDRRLNQVADMCAVTRRYGDYRELIADPAIDVVAVCTPVSEHETQACAVLRANKHLYVEKPLAHTAAAAAAITRAAEQSTGVATVGVNLRSHRLVAKAREVIGSGTLGPIQTLRSTWTSSTHPGSEWPRWRYCRADGGGVIFEKAIHHVDLWRFLLNDDVAEIYALSHSSAGSDDINASISARMFGGAVVAASFSQNSSDANEVEVAGRDAILRFSCYRADSLRLQAITRKGGGAAARITQAASRIRQLPSTLAAGLGGGDFLQSYVRHWQAYIDSIVRGKPPPCSLVEGERALGVILGAIESVRKNQPTVLSRQDTESLF